MIIFAPLLAQVSKAQSDVRDLGREAFGGNAAADLLAGVEDRVKNDLAVQKIIASTPLPKMYEGERLRIMGMVTTRAEAAVQVKAAVAARDQKAFTAAAKVYDANSEAKYVEPYLRMMQKVVALGETFDREGREFQKAVDAL